MSDEITQRTRPVMNVENRPLVEALYGVAAAIETSGKNVADGLRDIAKAVQLSPDKPHDLQRERIARLVDEHAGEVKLGHIIREAGT